MTPDSDPRLDLHFIAVRQGIGLLGLFLPLALFAYGQSGPGRMQPTISEFYFTAMGDVFVGTMVAIGVFLISYRGYRAMPKRFPLGDRATSIIAGLSALGVALFPAQPQPGFARCIEAGALKTCSTGLPDPTLLTGLHHITGPLHLGSAALFFLALAYFCLVLFPMGGTPRSAEHLIYRICGGVLLAAILAATLYATLPTLAPLRAFNFIFWVETAGVLAFAIAWLTKGKMLTRPLGMALRHHADPG